MSDKYETVIGLEVHIQLDTQTKAFCSCSTNFGAEPNTQVCPVCLGLPGVLPVLNKKFFEYGIRVALALDCDIQKKVKFDRKNYYYPDLPKNYQISQYDMPLAYDGKVAINIEGGKTKEIGVTRAHMEEDAGKLLHDEKQPFSYVDLNRTGTPLLEVVSEPDIRTPEEAYEYLVTLKQIIEYLDVSDCNMEEGSLRCDANISLRKKGASELGSKVEIKNLNSFKAVREALAFEEVRQEEMLEGKERIPQQTRLWDENNGETISMRSKEDTQDYRYFPEPDLVPFEVQDGVVEEARKALPELPRKKKKRFMKQYKLGTKDIEDLILDRNQADYFERLTGAYDNPKFICNWIKGKLKMYAKQKGTDVVGLNLDDNDVIDMMKMEVEGVISGTAATDLIGIHIETGKKPEKIVKEKGLEQVSDKGALGEAVQKVISGNEKSANDYKNGKTNALSFLVGQVMKETKGKANPKLVGEMLREALG